MGHSPWGHIESHMTEAISTHACCGWTFRWLLCPGSCSEAMNIVVHVSFPVTFFLDICPGIGLLDHMVALFLVF